MLGMSSGENNREVDKIKKIINKSNKRSLKSTEKEFEYDPKNVRKYISLYDSPNLNGSKILTPLALYCSLTKPNRFEFFLGLKSTSLKTRTK